MKTHLIMRKAMKVASHFDMLDFLDDISISTTRSGSNDILVERKWNKGNQQQQIHDCTHCTHCLGSRKNMLLANFTL